MQPLLYQAIEAAITAAAEIMDVYNNHDFQIQQKDDNSPLTVADLRAHHTIKKRLEKTGIPLLSEEGAEIPYGERKLWIVSGWLTRSTAPKNSLSAVAISPSILHLSKITRQLQEWFTRRFFSNYIMAIPVAGLSYATRLQSPIPPKALPGRP